MVELFSPGLAIILVGALVGIAASLVGVFLVLRKVSMLSDAISHAILLGIVLVFFLTGDQHSPFYVVGAALAGVLTVFLTELLTSSKLVKEDAAIGLVFPALFALAVLLINLYARDVHIDVHAVLLGEIAFTWLDVLEVGPYLIPLSFVIMGTITLINVLFVWLLYKELKLVTFDPALAVALGFSPAILHYALLTLTSITAVGAFDAVGAILFIAFVIVPPAAAYLLADKLWQVLAYSVAIAIASSVTGYYGAVLLDVSIGGAMASMTGVFLLLSFLFSPKYGLVAQERLHRRQRLENAQRLLLVHLYHHEAEKQSDVENAQRALESHLRWSSAKAERIVRRSVQRGLIARKEGILNLTAEGRRLAQEVLEPWAR